MRNPIRRLEGWLRRTLGSDRTNEKLAEVGEALKSIDERLQKLEAGQVAIKRALYIDDEIEFDIQEQMRAQVVPQDPHLGR